MKNIYFTVGPSQIYPGITDEISVAVKKEILSLSHRSEEFHKLFDGVREKLRSVLGIPDTHEIFLINSGTEGMERVIENCVEKTSFHVITGTFGNRFYQSAIELNKDAVKVESAWGSGIELSTIDIPKDTELLAVTHNDTSSGVCLDLKPIYDLKKERGDILIALDTVSSVPSIPIDFSLLDCVFFSVQKGFGLPAGLGVLIVSPQAMEKSFSLQKKGISIGTFHNFPTLKASADKSETPETPNVLDLYLFDKVLGLLLERGMESIRKITQQRAALLYELFDQSDLFEPIVTDPAVRSVTTLVVEVPGGSVDLLEKAEAHGLVIGAGYGKFANTQIRVGNFPAHTQDDFEKLLDFLKTYSGQKK